eukprot:m.76203 g.76203  ORF g.76203 m.76203 type:complete len:51 (-) comp10505_c1_seq3:640-792(-)
MVSSDLKRAPPAYLAPTGSTFLSPTHRTQHDLLITSKDSWTSVASTRKRI